MSSKKPTFIALDYPSETFYYLKKVVCTSGPLVVNDTNSPGGKRTTTLFSVVLIDMKGCRVAVEVWGPYAAVVEDHFMFVYLLS